MGVWPAWASAAVVCVAEFMPVIVIGPERGEGAGAGGFYDGAWRVGLAWGASGQKGQQDDAVDQDEDAEDAHGRQGAACRRAPPIIARLSFVHCGLNGLGLRRSPDTVVRGWAAARRPRSGPRSARRSAQRPQATRRWRGLAPAACRRKRFYANGRCSSEPPLKTLRT